jgi:hypothetical protein
MRVQKKTKLKLKDTKRGVSTLKNPNQLAQETLLRNISDTNIIFGKLS